MPIIVVIVPESILVLQTCLIIRCPRRENTYSDQAAALVCSNVPTCRRGKNSRSLVVFIN